MSRTRKFLLALLAALVIIQFFRPAKNITSDRHENDITTAVTVSPEVMSLLKSSCYDCHSNDTHYPWYAEVQPVAWWLQHHVNEGKEELNFDAFGAYSPRRRFRKLDEIAEQVQDGEMPLSSYTLIHRDAKLTAEQQAQLIEWTKAAREEMKAQYPADSLKPNRK